jgi:hypothetical protein
MDSIQPQDKDAGSNQGEQEGKSRRKKKAKEGKKDADAQLAEMATDGEQGAKREDAEGKRKNKKRRRAADKSDDAPNGARHAILVRTLYNVGSLCRLAPLGCMETHVPRAVMLAAGVPGERPLHECMALSGREGKGRVSKAKGKSKRRAAEDSIPPPQREDEHRALKKAKKKAKKELGLATYDVGQQAMPMLLVTHQSRTHAHARARAH